MKAIAAVDIMDGKVVRLLRGNPKESTIYGDDPVAMAKRWAKEGADMLHIVDLDATLGRGSNLNLIKEIATTVDVPVEIAGGLRNAKILDKAASCADCLVLGTLAFEDHHALEKARSKYGTDRLIISVDHRDGIIVINGWQSSTGVDLLKGVDSLCVWDLPIFF
ncbi:MAG: Histidine biosynthesis protein HisA [Cenarchaeum symbiont of Oopsacas minuta]|nr:Histidine biosynthesis protein HisA [Cenarchaeum symbiont of Oopsacas minuta]